MNINALFNISYGLYVLTSRDENKDNGCIINTLSQVTSQPCRVSITVNKQNYTHDMIAASGQFNVSMLDQSAPFAIFKHFGFQSGRTADKFGQGGFESRSENGLIYLPEHICAYVSGRVIAMHDLGTHTMFIADVIDAETTSEKKPMTYEYYFAAVKPKPEKKAGGWRCKICGYVYEGENLPTDFICPTCKHPAYDFEKIV
ncbi:MAG: flavin reductase [Clostridia bacterium]|nr:flavin reductase [Clostridia bacterium]